MNIKAKNGGSVATSESSAKTIKKMIERRHPKYEERLEHWAFLEQTYEGGREWFVKNIFRYLKEGDGEYNSRVSRSYRFNHTREVVDLINKYLFKQNITRNEKDVPACLRDFWARCTRNGMGISDFARQISKLTSIFGRIAIVVDRTTAAGEILSVKDEREAGIQTYAYTVPPERVLDYSYDAQGELNWVMIAEVSRDDADPLTSSGDMVVKYRLWTKTRTMLFAEVKSAGKSKTFKIESTVDHDLGIVPVVLADHIVSDELYSSPSMIDDIAYLDRAVANYLSNVDAIIQDQTFSQLAMPAQSLSPGEDGYDKMKEVGTNRIFLYDGNGGTPMFLSPDVKQAQIIITTIKTIINEIYHTVGLAGERTKQDNALGIDNSSGVAKAYDFERVNALLAAKADSLEMIENRIAAIVVAWNGESIKEELGRVVSYPNNFDTRGLYDEFDIAARLMLIDSPDSIRREQMTKLIEKLFPQMPVETKKLVEKELEKWPPVMPTTDPLADTSTLPADQAQVAKRQNNDSANNVSKAV